MDIGKLSTLVFLALVSLGNPIKKVPEGAVASVFREGRANLS